MEVEPVRTPGLGNTTYIASHGDVAIVVDPTRDIDRFLAAVEGRPLEVRWVMETHLHNDYLSGARHLARALGADLVLPAGAAPAYRHTPAFHGESLIHGEVSVQPLHTPGHTPEHTSYLVIIDGMRVCVFSGGSLLVGSAGRTDLLGTERAESLARLQYTSINRLAALPEATALYPTHGAGSFCTVSPAGRSSSTIGDERRSNPVLAHVDEESFVSGQLTGLDPFPAYYARMGPMNLSGPAPMPKLEVPRLAFDQAMAVKDAYVVDTRPQTEFAAGHIPGSLGIELSNDFATWVGWVLEIDRPLILVTGSPEAAANAVRQLARIGIDDVRGYLPTLEGWPGELTSFLTVDAKEFAAAVESGEQTLDVRAPSEVATATVPGVHTIYVPDLAHGDTNELDPGRPVWVACATGYRASIAASLLEADFTPVVLSGSGMSEVRSILAD